MAVWCGYCDEGNVQHDGWHDIPSETEMDTGYRVPCALYPPRVETIEGDRV